MVELIHNCTWNTNSIYIEFKKWIIYELIPPSESNKNLPAPQRAVGRVRHRVPSSGRSQWYPIPARNSVKWTSADRIGVNPCWCDSWGELLSELKTESATQIRALRREYYHVAWVRLRRGDCGFIHWCEPLPRDILADPISSRKSKGPLPIWRSGSGHTAITSESGCMPGLNQWQPGACDQRHKE